MSGKRIGAFICHCGGNISDYVDEEKVRAAAEKESGVAVAKTFLFACSEACPAGDDPDPPGREARRHRDRLLLPETPSHHLPRHGAAGRIEPVHVHPGQRPGAMFLGASARTGRGHREGGPPRAGRDRADPARRAADRSPDRDDPRGSGRRGGRRGDAGGFGALRHRDVRVPGRTRHGGRGTRPPVGQDVPQRPGRGGDDRDPARGDPRPGGDHPLHGCRGGREKGEA